MPLRIEDERRLSWQAYFREVADRMRLKDWTVEVAPDPPADSGALAEVVCTYGRLWATVRLGDGFLVRSPEEQRHAVVHELVHCHTDLAAQIALEAMPEAVKAVFRRLKEHETDALAEIIAPHMPLPLQGVREAIQEAEASKADVSRPEPPKGKGGPRTASRGM
jgi:hypothetical protein